MRVSIGLVFTVFFLCVWVHGLDLGRIRASIEQIRWSVLTIAIIFFAGGCAVRTARWWWIPRACSADTEFRACVWPLVLGSYPFRAGDVCRIMRLRQELRAPVAQLIGTLPIERTSDLTVLLGLFLVAVAFLAHFKTLAAQTRTASVVVAAIILAWTLTLLWAKRPKVLFTPLCHHTILTSRASTSGAERQICQLFEALEVMREPSRTPGLLAVSTVVWSCEGSIFEIVAYRLSYHDHVHGPWFAFSSVRLSTLIRSLRDASERSASLLSLDSWSFGTSRRSAVALAFVVHSILGLAIT